MSTKPDSQPTISKTKRSQTTAKAENDQREPPVEFLWIDAKEEDPRDRDASREKQSFIRARHHRLKKESQMRSLKTSMQQRPAKSDFTPPKTASDHTSEDRCLIAQSPILCQPLEACISMAFPYLSRPTNQSMTLYLQHCKYTRATITKSLALHEIKNLISLCHRSSSCHETVLPLG